MADVKVIVTNKAGHQVGLTLDDKKDAERIDYLKKQVKADVFDDVQVESAEKPLEKRTAAELKKYAEENGVALGEATSKADILTAITAAQQN